MMAARLRNEFSEGQACPSTFRNGKFSTSLGEYSISFPPEAISEPDGNFSFHGSRPKNHFYTHKSLNLLSLLWIQYIQWKPDIQCQLKLNFFGPSQSIIQDYNLRKRHFLIYFSVLYFFSTFLWISISLFLGHNLFIPK